jgi:hypothetical protein
VVAGLVAAGLTGCGDPAAVADVERCLERRLWQVERPQTPARIAPLLAEGVRLAVRARDERRGAMLFFLAPDEASALEAQGRLRSGLGVAGEEVKRDGPWVVLAQAPRQEAQDAFNCVR